MSNRAEAQPRVRLLPEAGDPNGAKKMTMQRNGKKLRAVSRRVCWSTHGSILSLLTSTTSEPTVLPASLPRSCSNVDRGTSTAFDDVARAAPALRRRCLLKTGHMAGGGKVGIAHGQRLRQGQAIFQGGI